MSRVSKLVNRARVQVGIKFTMPKLFVPVGCHTPATAKETVAKQLYEAGVIGKSDYEKMLGVVYDGDFEIETEVFNDEAFPTQADHFSQSEFSDYDDQFDSGTEPILDDDNQATSKVASPGADDGDPSSAPSNSKSQDINDDSSMSGNVGPTGETK